MNNYVNELTNEPTKKKTVNTKSNRLTEAISLPLAAALTPHHTQIHNLE